MTQREPREDFRHLGASYQRWMDRRNRKQESPDYRDEWYAEQCGHCRFWVPLTGALGADWGVCTNPRSPFDGRVQFEHDGCDEFEPSEGWAVTPGSREEG